MVGRMHTAEPVEISLLPTMVKCRCRKIYLIYLWWLLFSQSFIQHSLYLLLLYLMILGLLCVPALTHRVCIILCVRESVCVCVQVYTHSVVYPISATCYHLHPSIPRSIDGASELACDTASSCSDYITLLAIVVIIRQSFQAGGYFSQL